MTKANCVNGKCLMPGGTFTMGSPKGVGYVDEHPQRKVTMSGFKIGQKEVSVGQYEKYLYELRGEKEVVEGVPKGIPNFALNKKGWKYPIVGLTFDEKRAYCQAQGGDLPTAAQLHFASRYDEVDSIVNGENRRIFRDILASGYGFNRFRSTRPVTSGYQNRFGVYNLLGNVWESSRDAYDKNFYAQMASTNPYSPMTNPWTRENRGGQLIEISGGYFNSYPGRVRVANRGSDEPAGRSHFLGFRCAWPADSK